MYKPKVYTASNLTRIKLWKTMREDPDWDFVEWTAGWVEHPLLDPPGEEPLDAETCAEGWAANLSDIRRSDFLLAYCYEPRTPLRGALVEIGIGLCAGLKVITIGADDSQTWSFHSRVTRLSNLVEARHMLYRYTAMVPPTLDRTRKDRTDANE